MALAYLPRLNDLKKQLLSSNSGLVVRAAIFFLVQTYQNWKNIPNDHKLYQTAKNESK
jgi:hypothetical protein